MGSVTARRSGSLVSREDNADARRFTKDEFDLRVSQALASRTYAELAAVAADLPARP
jgi:hypothetical protein